jgi:hypothetical protein
MGLELPADLEPYTNGLEDAHAPGAYCLLLSKPQDLEERWHQHNDTKPPYWDQLVDAPTVAYVGGTGDLLSRLEDHRNGDVRTTTLTEVCGIEKLHTAWVDSEATHAREILEPRVAGMLRREYPRWFVHQR